MGKITAIEALKSSMETVVDLPPFSKDVSFSAKLRRPSLLMLVNAGKIPNQLLPYANELFTRGAVNTKDVDGLSKTYQVLEAICKASFVEPTYQELVDAGIELTDEQMLFVFNYSQVGVKALANFRQKP